MASLPADASGDGGGSGSAGMVSTLAALRATVIQRVDQYDKDRALQRLQDAALRGAMAGVTVRGGLHLVSSVLHLLAARRRKRGGQQAPGVAEMLRDTARWAAFLGAFSGVFVLSDELIACLGGRKRTRAWRAMAAGTLAGPTMLLAGGEQAHTSLALYLVVRGLTLLVRCGNLPEAHPLKRALLAPTHWAHGDVALMCVATGQLAYSWICLPQTLPPSFVRFLNKHGGKPLHIYEAIREMSGRAAAGHPPARLAALNGTELSAFCGATACQLVHPMQSCGQHALAFLPEAYLRALPVYFPVYVLPAILVHRKRLVDPQVAPGLWRKVGVGLLRSSLFLSLYCTLAWRGACTGFTASGRTTGGVIAASCWVAGLAVLVEKRSRRMELALYCLSRAVESFALCCVAWGLVRPGALPRRVDVLLFSLAAGFICHCYSDHYGQRRGVFRSSYLNVFDFILGNTGFQQASISHQPSNADILLRGVRSVKSMGNLLRLGSQGGSGGGFGGTNGGGSGNHASAGASPSLSPRPDAALALAAVGEDGPAADSAQAGAAASAPWLSGD